MLALKFSTPTGSCRSFPREWWSAARCHPAAHPFHLTLRRDVLSRRDLGAARKGPISSQVQSGSISDSGQGCRVCLGLGGAGCRSRAVAWCAATNFSARSRNNELTYNYRLATRFISLKRSFFCAKNLPDQATGRCGPVVCRAFPSFGSLSMALRMDALWC